MRRTSRSFLSCASRLISPPKSIMRNEKSPHSEGSFEVFEGNNSKQPSDKRARNNNAVILIVSVFHNRIISFPTHFCNTSGTATLPSSC